MQAAACQPCPRQPLPTCQRSTPACPCRPPPRRRARRGRQRWPRRRSCHGPGRPPGQTRRRRRWGRRACARPCIETCRGWTGPVRRGCAAAAWGTRVERREQPGAAFGEAGTQPWTSRPACQPERSSVLLMAAIAREDGWQHICGPSPHLSSCRRTASALVAVATGPPA
jgi:hypothetical protein